MALWHKNLTNNQLDVVLDI